MADNDSLAAEVLRLRDQMHDARSKLEGLAIHQTLVLRWQEHYEPIIEDLREADRIAEAVAKRMTEQSQSTLTKDNVRFNSWQAYAAIASCLLVAAAFFYDVASRL